MKYGKILLPMAAFAACLLIGIAPGQEYLEGGNLGRSDYSDIVQYFNDPIFYMDPTGSNRRSWEQEYYPYFGAEFFNDYTQPFRPGIYTGPFGAFPYNQVPYDSEFRLSSLAGMQWEPFQKNWAKTLNHTRTSSSLKVYRNGVWITP